MHHLINSEVSVGLIKLNEQLNLIILFKDFWQLLT